MLQGESGKVGRLNMINNILPNLPTHFLTLLPTCEIKGLNCRRHWPRVLEVALNKWVEIGSESTKPRYWNKAYDSEENVLGDLQINRKFEWPLKNEGPYSITCSSTPRKVYTLHRNHWLCPYPILFLSGPLPVQRIYRHKNEHVYV